MREYAKVAPQFWHGKTGKELKKQGTEAVIVALYLMTCQHANMLGLYYVSPTYIAVDTGLGLEGALKGLAGACEGGFCRYDQGSEVVWVVEMAAYQIGDNLDAKDNRCKGIQREYDALPDNPFLGPFYERYGAVFHMTSNRGAEKALRSPSKAPPKPRARARAGARTGAGDSSGETPGSLAWKCYAEAYRIRYGADPVRNAQVNSQLAKLVEKLGAEEAPLVASFFVGHEGRFYVESMHAVSLLLRDAEKLRTEWVTGRKVPTIAQRPTAAEQRAMQAVSPSLLAPHLRPTPGPVVLEAIDVTPRKLG